MENLQVTMKATTLPLEPAHNFLKFWPTGRVAIKELKTLESFTPIKRNSVTFWLKAFMLKIEIFELT